MEVILHNKYEIITNNKTYVAYNTITNKIFECIKEFKQFATYFAFGNGLGEVTYDDSKMVNHTFSYPSTLEEISCDPTKTMFVRRTVTIGEDEHNGKQFTEIGLTNTNADNPNIFSHVKITDEEGNQVKVVKKSGQIMFIRVTVYLTVDEQSKPLLTAGENLLIKAILGELQSYPTITAARGSNLEDNSKIIYRNVPRNSTQYSCTLKTETLQDSHKLNFEFDLGGGETPEVVIMFNGKPVSRFSLMGDRLNPASSEVLTSQTNATLDLGKYVSSVQSITDGTEVVMGYKLKKYAKEFSDYIANPFDANFTSTSPRFVSKDGDKIAFIADGSVYLYRNLQYSLQQIANSISSTNIKNIIIFEDYVFVVYTSSPYLKLYIIDDNTTYNMPINFEAYENFDTTYDWQDVHIINDDNGNFTLGIVLGEINRNPVIAKAKIVENVFKFISAQYGQTDYIANMFSLYKNPYCSSMIGFVTNNFNSITGQHRIEQCWADGTTELTNEIYAYAMLNNTASLEGKNRAVIAKKTSKPYIWLFYYPNLFRYSISLTEGVQNWISTSLMYLIQKYEGESATYKIYSLTNYNNPEEFIDGIPSEIDQSTITDFEFLADTLLIFTTSGVKAINLKQVYTVAENLPQANTDYTVTTITEDVYGSTESEGVLGKFTVEFSV